ncbi:unnamed protein product [Pneumocystis jirovecii]|uniref:DNA 5'-3' helicase n=1 Tax=Pneumocystis jirovecii TaxID=42068 RepID=L0PD55_PNEJI|nr:unnamed protein product [Pneumocystis jirovecii]
MKFFIDDLPVLFPYPRIYPEQYAYMCHLKKTLDAGGHCVLEMPSGTGKTVSLLSLIISYQKVFEQHRKLVYCSRTMSEIEKILVELKNLIEFRKKISEENSKFRALGLTSRKNLCLHPSIKHEKKGNIVDARCRGLTASFVREKKKAGEKVNLCLYYENLNFLDFCDLIPYGVFTFTDLIEYGEKNQQCPYFIARRMIPFCNVVVYSYHYLLDPKISEFISRELSKDCIVVFDEAHNIDNVCIESLSVDITEDSLKRASHSINSLETKIANMKKNNAEKLQMEYRKLVEGLREIEKIKENDIFITNSILSDDLLKEAIPGNIRKAEHFVAFLKRFVEYMKTRMKVLHVIAETPLSFLQHLKELTYIESKPLRFCAERLNSLIRTLELSDIEDYQYLQEITDFATLVSTYEKGFIIILEPFETDTATVPNPVFHFTCLDASIAIKPIFAKFKSVIITSGTISPLDMYPKILQFNAVIQESYNISLARNSFLPMIITRGSNQVAISSKFEVRDDPSVVRNYGDILLEFSKITPDGLVAFFPSYIYMESINEIWKYKLILVETPDSQETVLALKTYRTACDNGRGAILLCVARGKISEGIDFDHHYGRTVIMFGIPYQYTKSRILKARLEFLRDMYHIKENDFLTFDAMRHAAQCLGRVLRGKDDYGIMVLADRRFSRTDKRNKLPKWIQQYITSGTSNLSTDMSIAFAEKFLKAMAQPFNIKDQEGISWWDIEKLHEYQKKEKQTESKNNEDLIDANENEYDVSDEILEISDDIKS